MTLRRLVGATLTATAAALIWAGSLHAAPDGPGHDGFFDDPSVVAFTIRAPLADLFSRGAQDEQFSVPATVTLDGAATALGSAALSVRGNTSRRECPFPKLKLEFDHRSEGGPFARLHTVRIGTHCGDVPGEQLTADFGRLPNEHSPWREGLVYRMLHAAGVLTSRARPARITYIDTSANGTIVPSPLSRNALIVEDDDDLKQRLDATARIEPADFTSARDLFNAADTARVAFGEAMIGNFDWCLQLTPDDHYRCDARKKLWNVVALRVGNGALPVLQDFDLAGTVTGRHIWFDRVFPRRFTDSPIDTEVIAQVQRTRSLFPRALLDATRQAFLSRRADVERAIATAKVDAHGAGLARAYAGAFYNAIGTDRDFYRPVVARAGVRIFTTADGATQACGTGETVPIGTPFQELRRDADRAQVQLLDVMWRWAPPTECEPVHAHPVWIDASSISSDYPPGRSNEP